MSLTRTQARDEVLTKLKAKLDTVKSMLDPSHVIYENTDTGSKPAEDLVPLPSWAAVFFRHADVPEDGTLTNREGERCYDQSGLITVQLFTPRDGLTTADSLVETIKSTFRGVSTPGGVWFRNVRAPEIGESGPWYQTNIIAEFVYHQFG